MSKRVISTSKAPAAIGPYSQAVSVTCGEAVYISGQIPLDPVTMKIVGETAADQAIQVFKNIQAILDSAGLEKSHVVKTTILLQSMDDFASVNEEYGKFFAEPYPARAAFAVAKLPKDALIEIEAIAMK